MHSGSIGKYGSREMYRLCVATLRCAAVFVLSAFGAANAGHLPPPFAGLLPDVGTSYFTPGRLVTAVEVDDTLEPATSFGFFFASDLTTLIPIFDGADLTSVESQTALIDFAAGLVYDGELGSPPPLVETLFTPAMDDIGFYLDLGVAVLYSDPVLNPAGFDLFSAFESDTDPSSWTLLFDGIEADGTFVPININVVAGISPAIPEPSVIALLAIGLPLMLVCYARRSGGKSRRVFIRT